MFKKILISLVVCIASLNAMDQEQPFPFQELPKDVKQLILAHAYKNHSTPEEAVRTFKNLALVCKDSVVVAKNSIHTKAIIKDLVKKYEAKAIAIPLALHSTRALGAFKRAYKKSLVALADEINALANTITPDEEQQYLLSANGSVKNFDINQLRYLIACGMYTHNLSLSVLFLRCVSNPEALKLLIACGADVNDKDPYGRSVLINTIISFCIKNHLPLVQILIAAGADATLRDDQQLTPLSWFLTQKSKSADPDKLITLLSLAGSDVGPLWVWRFWLPYKFTKHAQRSACTIV